MKPTQQVDRSCPSASPPPNETSRQGEIAKVALKAIMSCYRITVFHLWYRMSWKIAVSMDLACLGSVMLIDFLFYQIFPEHKKKTLEPRQITRDIKKIMQFIKSGVLNAIIGLSTIALRTYVEGVYATLEDRSVFVHFIRSSFAILTVSSIMKYGFGYTTRNILDVMSYHIWWGAVAIAALLVANKIFNESLKKYTLAHGVLYVKNLFIEPYKTEIA